MWTQILTDIAGLLEPVSDDELRRRWQGFVTRHRDQRPYHLDRIVSELEDVRQGRPPTEIAILDHGCGPCSTLIWLAALGYTNVRGVDVGGDFAAANRLALVCWKSSYSPFTIYDGHRLPYDDGQFDLIISQQVLEHVPDDQFESYYLEEARVLRAGGRALHQVPHRMIPYDGHTRTWFVHILPRQCWPRVMNMMGQRWPDHLHLRWPWTHMRMLRQHIGPAKNLSVYRLATQTDFSYYDGCRTLRMFLAKACRLPVAGYVIATVLTAGVLLETRAIRRVK